MVRNTQKWNWSGDCCYSAQCMHIHILVYVHLCVCESRNQSFAVTGREREREEWGASKAQQEYKRKWWNYFRPVLGQYIFVHKNIHSIKRRKDETKAVQKKAGGAVREREREITSSQGTSGHTVRDGSLINRSVCCVRVWVRPHMGHLW